MTLFPKRVYSLWRVEERARTEQDGNAAYFKLHKVVLNPYIMLKERREEGYST